MAAIGNRYARALVDVVFDRRAEAKALDPDKVRGELELIAGLVAQSKELREVWESPALSSEQKHSVLDALVTRSRLSRTVRNFMAVLIDHGRIPLLGEIVRQFGHELDRRLNLADAEITTARDLRDNEKRLLETQIEKLTGKKVRARYQRDTSILGGAVIKLGSTIYDGSILGQLNKIREQLSTG
jgi:F-type H+-transporting ATPase subunit delta